MNKLFNEHTIIPNNLTQYTAFRGVTDFTQIGQFDQYETGYQFLEVIAVPKFLQALAEKDTTFAEIQKSFVHMLEFEFRGLEGLNDITTDTMSITDGINEMRMINKVSWDTSVTISMPYFEKRGSLIEKYHEYYITGIKDPKTQAKTYHGAIANNMMTSAKMAPSFENEVFTLLYYVTDNTMLRLERAVLLCNCQLTKAEVSMYNGSRDSINNRETQIEFNCFPVMGYEVDKAANYLLKNITGYSYDASKDQFVGSEKTILDSSSYRYGIMTKGNPAASIADGRLADAADGKVVNNPWTTGGYNGKNLGTDYNKSSGA
jgi:hypothetical protein